MSSTASAEGPLDVSSPVRGEIVVSLSAALRRHPRLQESSRRKKRGDTHAAARRVVLSLSKASH